jgi:hypothetical protein
MFLIPINILNFDLIPIKNFIMFDTSNIYVDSCISFEIFFAIMFSTLLKSLLQFFFLKKDELNMNFKAISAKTFINNSSYIKKILIFYGSGYYNIINMYRKNH